MINEAKSAFNDTLQMFEDGIRKIPDEHWRQGSNDFLIPVRIAYHIMMGLDQEIIHKTQWSKTCFARLPDRIFYPLIHANFQNFTAICVDSKIRG